MTEATPAASGINRADWLRPLGPTGLTTSALIAGGAPIGSMPEIFGYDVPAEQGISLVEDLLRSPITTIDTSNMYSDGESERRIGAGISRLGGVPADHWIATKVDGKDGDYSGARVRESVRESQQRLGLDFLPLVQLHDPEFADFADLTAPGGAVDTLVELKREGVIGVIGVAGGHTPTLQRFLDLEVFDVLLSHNRWTLVDRGADDLFTRAFESGVAVINAAILGGGFFVDPVHARNYGYQPVTVSTREAGIRMRDVCASFGTDLVTAALQFSVRDPRIAASVVGFSKPERIASVVASVDHPLPDELWGALDALTPPPADWLD